MKRRIALLLLAMAVLPAAAGAARIRVTAGDRSFEAELRDNAAATAFWDMLPLTLPMMNLYGREMCNRMGNGTLPDDTAEDLPYEIGDISYWPPAGSLVILYKQNGEIFEQMPIAHTDADVSFFDGMGTTDVTFEKVQPTPVVVTVGGKRFAALVEDTATGRAFLEKLPLTLDMQELNGNEKYRYGVALPTAAVFCATIEAGDLMLYGSNCLVLFYGAAGGYSYTRVGRLVSTEGLAEAVGSDTATVTFEKVELRATIELDGDGVAVGAVTNLPDDTPIATLAAEQLGPGEIEWRDYASLDDSAKDRCRFFRLKATIQANP